MISRFFENVQGIVEPTLVERGFVRDEVNDSPDSGGRERHVVYYRSDDCRIQIFESSRDCEVNAMLAPLSAPNQFGPQTNRWQYFGRFAKRPDLPLDELVQRSKSEYDSYADPLEWVRDRILDMYESAHAGILEMYGQP